MLTYPRLFFIFSLFVLWLAEQIGAFARRRQALKDDEREDFGILQAACLTLLSLIIGFSFSMAISRYDLRKNYEEAEANAIGTEYVRTGLLPVADAAAVRAQLKKYLDLRILFYRTRNEGELLQINTDTGPLQARRLGGIAFQRQRGVLWWPLPRAVTYWSALVGVALSEAPACFLFYHWLSPSHSF